MKRIIPLSPRRWLALEIFRRMKRERIEEHPLRQLFWECTLRCNVRCRHCGSDCKSSPSTPDMPLEDFLKVLDSIATHTDPHNVFVIISGGEPTVREDLETCAKEISVGNGMQRTLPHTPTATQLNPQRYEQHIHQP